MTRRKFITTLLGAAAWPHGSRAQQPAKLRVIGYLGTTSAAVQSHWVAAFVQRLRELNWIEGSNIAIEYRWAGGRSELLAEFAAEFVTRKVDVIVAPGTGLVAAKQATSVIPIVFPMATDPIGSGFVASLARPGGNMTGLSGLMPDLAGKRIDLMREVIRDFSRLAIMANGGNPAAVREMREFEHIARSLGLEVATFELRNADDIASAFEALRKRAQSVYVVTDALMNTHRARITELALRAGLPTMFALREYVEAGGLISYGPNFLDLYRRAADYVDKIFRGAKAAEIPVEQPTKFDLIINLKTAKALGLDVSPMLLARADEVIE